MAQEIDINLNVNAEQADKSLGSLKSQLREAQAEVQTLADKFGATSREAVEAAKRAAELKDRIGDAKSLTEAFNPDAKFKALSSSLSGVAGGFAAYQGALSLIGVESKELEQQLLKVQSAMALSQGLQSLGEARDSFKQLGAVAADALKGIKTGILATGIGVLVVALGAIVAYWDDIKQAVNGVSAAQANLNAKVNDNYQTQLLKLKTLDNQDNVLRLQGKSEDYILKKKNEQITKAIELGEIALRQNISNVKSEVAAAERNERYTKLIFERSLQLGTFIVRLIAKPFDVIIAGVNKVSDALGFQKVVAMNVTDVLDAGIDKATTFVSTKLFDSAGIKAEGKKATQALTEELQNLENTKAGNQIKINENNKKENEKNKKEEVLSEHEKLEKLKKLNEEYNKKLREEDRQVPDEIDITGLENKAANDVKFKEEELDRQRAQELALAEIYYNSVSEREKREEEERQRKLQKFQATTEAVGSIAKSGEDLLGAIQANGLARGKAGQAAMKALALVQIGADSAIAFSKMLQGTESSAAGAASVAGPAAPAVYTATKIAFYASGTATILANIARARALLSGGGGGGGGAAGVGGGGAVAAAPSFNIVGPSGANQIAESIGNKESQPLKAFVVGGDVTSQQSLNRGIVQNATLG